MRIHRNKKRAPTEADASMPESKSQLYRSRRFIAPREGVPLPNDNTH